MVPMPADRDPPTAADYAVTAVSPALIMLMVGSLVFFLITVLPTGDYKERLLYTTFFFVFGAVLIARIAIQYDAGRASMYGIGLGIVTFLAMSAYVDYPAGTGLKAFGWLVNLGFMGLIWWSAHKLTWDCTHVDENRDASGRGLLSAAGLSESDSGSESDRTEQTAPRSRDPKESEGEPKKKKKKKKVKRQSSFSAWTGRWWAHHDKQKGKPHTPGVWVIYFALAALPLFAIGQSLIPAEDGSRRWAAFLQMVVYVGSGLGLLVTTSLLGLRRYLRQRKAKVPAALTAGWLGLGGVLIAVFLVVGAFFPRPYSEVPWFGLPQAGKSEREASQYAQLRSSAGKGEGAEGDVTEKGRGSASGKNGEPGGGKGEKGSGGKGQGKGSGGRDNNGGKGGGDSRSRDPEGSAKDGGDDKDDGKQGRDGNTDREGKDAQGKSNGRERSSGRSPSNLATGALGKMAEFLKWVVLAVVVFLVLLFVVLAVLRYLAPFTEWARNLLDFLRNFWANLFGTKAARTREVEEVVKPTGPQRPPPFTAFSNPFADGTADSRVPGWLVEYTFAALDSWAWDRGHGRSATETPLEFASRLGVEFPDFETSLRRLANLYARVAYATGPLPADAVPFLDQFWDQLIHGADMVAVA
jgi:hypothetical protein